MHRSVVSFILVASLVILAALLGLLGYRAFQKYYLPMVRPRPIPSPLVMGMGPDLVISDTLRSTPTGIVADVRLTNKSTEDFTRVAITDLKYDSYSAKPLPIVVTGLAVGKSTTVTVPIPGLKTTTTSYRSYDYKYDWKSGGGSGTSSMGMPPPVKSPTMIPPKKTKQSAGIKV